MEDSAPDVIDDDDDQLAECDLFEQPQKQVHEWDAGSRDLVEAELFIGCGACLEELKV